jgi:glycine/D-amino acid oxidase-like deaminating enzyme
MTADVAILGAGIAGTALAAELAVRGVRVRVYERRGIAAAASGRNAGVLWEPTDPVLASLYHETLARYRALPEELAAVLPAEAPERAFRVPDRPAGILELGWDEDAVREEARRVAVAHPGLGAAYLDPPSLRRLEPGLADGLAAIRLDIGYPVAPASAARALAALALAHGAEIHEGHEARLARDGDAVHGVVVDGALVPAGAVVVAAGPWTPALVDPGGSWRPIRPAWGVIVELELGQAAPRHVLEEATVADVLAGDGPGDADGPDGPAGFSLVSHGGSSSLGSTFLPAEPDPRAWEARLRHAGAGYLPALAAAPAVGVRACARPVALDGRPLVGPVPGVANLFVLAGHGPWGISTGPASARHLAALLMGEADPRPAAVSAATDPARFGAPPSTG